MIKRFYHRLFIKDNQRLVRKRFINLEFSQVHKKMEEFVNKYFNIEDEDKARELALYLVIVLGIKLKIPSKLKNETTKQAEDFRILISCYSKRGFSRIHESEYFRIILNNIAKWCLPDSNKLWMDHLRETEKKYIDKNSENYQIVFEDLFKKWEGSF